MHSISQFKTGRENSDSKTSQSSVYLDLKKQTDYEYESTLEPCEFKWRLSIMMANYNSGLFKANQCLASKVLIDIQDF